MGDQRLRALIFGVLIVPGGRLADLIGRRRVFFIGAAIFALFSLLGGLAPDAWVLITCRALMGIGGALMWPATLGMTYSILPHERAALAGSLILGAAGFGNAAGPLIGGFLTDTLSWRWILFLNVPIAVLACLVTWRAVPESRGDAVERRFDYRGVATLAFGLIALLVALDEVDDYGWGSWQILGLLALCVVLLAAFVLNERRVGNWALVPPDVVSNRPFAAACLAILLMSPTFFVALVYLPRFMQKILGYSPVEAGLGLLPMMGVFALVSFAPSALRASRAAPGPRGRRGLPGRRACADLIGRDRRQLAQLIPDGGPRRRGRALLQLDHHRGRDRAGSVAVQAWPAASSTCSRSRAARSGWVSRPPSSPPAPATASPRGSSASCAAPSSPASRRPSCSSQPLPSRASLSPCSSSGARRSHAAGS